MQIGPLFNPLIRIDGVNLSDHFRSATINSESEDLDATGFGQTSKAHRQGLSDDSFEFEAFQDTEANKIDATLWPLKTSGDPFFVYVLEDADTALATTNPAWQGYCVLLSYSPLAAEVGQMRMTTVTMPLYSGTIIRVTSGTYS
jgi:hypothetical protein